MVSGPTTYWRCRGASRVSHGEGHPNTLSLTVTRSWDLCGLGHPAGSRPSSSAHGRVRLSITKVSGTAGEPTAELGLSCPKYASQYLSVMDVMHDA